MRASAASSHWRPGFKYVVRHLKAVEYMQDFASPLANFNARDHQGRKNVRTEFWSIDIPAAPEVVFPYLWETALIERWVTGHGKAEYRFPAEPRMERTAVTSIRMWGGWRLAAECNKVDINREVAHRFVQGPIKGTERWVVEPNASGGTKMSKILTYEIDGTMNRLGWFLFGRRMHSNVAKQELMALRIVVAG